MKYREEDIEKYADIIDLPHHVSKKHKPMAIADRAAQFAPFAALSGFEDKITDRAGSELSDVESQVTYISFDDE